MTLLTARYTASLTTVSAIMLVAIAIAFTPVVTDLVVFWLDSEEYSYGLLIPFVSGYILYLKKYDISARNLKPSWFAISLLALALPLYFVSVLADIDTGSRYALLATLACGVLVAGGITLFRICLFPLALLFFSLPLPYLLNVMLTAKMQLISSDLGVLFIQLMQLPVEQSGNVIRMSGFEMLVAEACSGLRYMYPLLVIAAIVAYFHRGGWLVKTTIVILAIPITILVNSLRIAMTGFLIKNFGQASAEGFLHDFEGVIIFVIAFVLLLLGVYAISQCLRAFGSRRQSAAGLSSARHSIADWFDFEQQGNLAKTGATSPQRLPIGPALVFSVIVAVSGLAINSVNISDTSDQLIRKPLDSFPFSIGQREIYPQLMTKDILDVLKADDLLLADYRADSNDKINLYIAYYESQREGSALHSPKACIPGDGWKIQWIKPFDLATIGSTGKANQVLIQKEEQQMLVYYWIHQQGKNYANELFARFSLLLQAFKTGRTDGALIRVIRSVADDQLEQAAADAEAFIADIMPILPHYIPDTRDNPVAVE